MVTSPRTSMRLFILGATGGTGRALIDQALERGHRVTAFVRSPQKLGGPREGVTVLQGDPRSVEELRGARLTVSRADVAYFLLEELEHRAHLRRIVGIASVKGSASQVTAETRSSV